jgi:hypothetical protein
MYKIFKRTAKTAEQFSRARKYHVAYVNSVKEALDTCKALNESRSERQVKNGTMFEFTKVG